MENKVFDLGTVLSITDGHLFAPISEVYEILNFMTGDNLFTHQLPRACEECRPVLLRKYPQLGEIKTERGHMENWREFLEQQKIKYGNAFEVEPVGIFEHKKIGPIEEAVSIFGKEKTIVLETK